MNKYIVAALRGFLWGYVFGYLFCVSGFLIFWWGGWMTLGAIFDVAAQLFFSRLQLFYVIVGLIFAVISMLRANETVREADDASRLWDVISSFFNRS